MKIDINSRCRIVFTAFFAIFAGVAVCSAGQDEVKRSGKITADRVNVRACAQSEAQVLGQLSHGDEVLLAGSISDAWVKIALPESFDVWIYSPLIGKDDAGVSSINVSRAQLRAGPGLNHASLGMGQRGQKLHVKGTSGDWTKVASSGLEVFGFVTNCYIEAVNPKPPAKIAHSAPAASAPPALPPPLPPPPPAVLETPAPRPVPSETPAPAPKLIEEIALEAPEKTLGAGRDVATATPSAKPRRTLLSGDAPAPVGPARIPSSRLRADMAQAAGGSYSGVLARAPTLGVNPTRWRLVHFTGPRSATAQTVCYVYGNDAQLSSLSGVSVVVSGAVYYFRGTTLPTVFAQDIVVSR